MDIGRARWATALTLTVASAVGSALLLTACTAATSAAGRTPTSAAPTSPKPEPTTSPAFKPPLTGLVDMSSQAAYSQAGAFAAVDTTVVAADAAAFNGIVINETWAQLEPVAGHPDWRPLDSSLRAVITYNAAHPASPLGVKLRVFGGFTAPDWAKSIAGTPITDPIRPHGKSGATLGRWWTTRYRQAWSQFQHALAARYDPDTLIRDVAVTSCATLTGEPFNTALSRQILPGMLADGWTPAAQEQCLRGAFADYSGWKTTSIDYAFSPYRTVTNGKPAPDPAVSDAVMASCAQSARTGGPHCIIGNHALQATAATAGSATVYSQIDSLWQQAPGSFNVYFQAVAPNRGDDCPSIALAIDHHASSVELWPPGASFRGYAAVPVRTLEVWNKALMHRIPLTCA